MTVTQPLANTAFLWNPKKQAPWVKLLPALAQQELKNLTDIQAVWRDVKRHIHGVTKDKLNSEHRLILALTARLAAWLSPAHPPAVAVFDKASAILNAFDVQQHSLLNSHKPISYPVALVMGQVSAMKHLADEPYNMKLAWKGGQGDSAVYRRVDTPGRDTSGDASHQLIWRLTLLLILTEDPECATVWSEWCTKVHDERAQVMKAMLESAKLVVLDEQYQKPASAELLPDWLTTQETLYQKISDVSLEDHEFDLYLGQLALSIALTLKADPDQKIMRYFLPSYHVNHKSLETFLALYQLPWLQAVKKTVAIDHGYLQEFIQSTINHRSYECAQFVSNNGIGSDFNQPELKFKSSSKEQISALITSDLKALRTAIQQAKSQEDLLVLHDSLGSLIGIQSIFKWICRFDADVNYPQVDKTYDNRPELRFPLSALSLFAGGLIMFRIKTDCSTPDFNLVLNSNLSSRKSSEFNALKPLKIVYGQNLHTLETIGTEILALCNQNDEDDLELIDSIGEFIAFLLPALPTNRPVQNQLFLSGTQALWSKCSPNIVSKILNHELRLTTLATPITNTDQLAVKFARPRL